MLIKGSRLDGEYFVWYERAVKAGLKIAQLYESYMITIHGKKRRNPCQNLFICIFCTDLCWIIRSLQCYMQM